MNGIATVTQRGQVVIPLPIRQLLGLKTADKLSFEVEENKIIARPVFSIDEALGMIQTQKKVSKKEFKKAVVEKTVEKFKK